MNARGVGFDLVDTPRRDVLLGAIDHLPGYRTGIVIADAPPKRLYHPEWLYK